MTQPKLKYCNNEIDAVMCDTFIYPLCKICCGASQDKISTLEATWARTCVSMYIYKNVMGDWRHEGHSNIISLLYHNWIMQIQ